MARNRELDEVRDFVIKLMTEEQDRHADMINNLRAQLGHGTHDDAFNTLSKIHEARMKILEAIYEKIKGV